MDRGSNVSWTSKTTIIFCVASLPLFVLFVFIEMKIAAFPFAPGHIIFHRSLVASYLTNYFGLAANMGVFFYSPLYMQAVDGLSATAAGVRLIPVMIFMVSGSLFGGLYMQKTGRYYRLTISSIFIGLLGACVTFSCSGFLTSSTPGITVGLCISCFGVSSAITTTLLSVLANADPADQAIATACTYLFRSLGSVTGVSIAATVVQQRLRVELRNRLENGKEADEIVEHVRQSLDFIKTLEPGVRVIVRKCYQSATNACFALSILVMCFALVASCFIKEKKLSR
jgi:predicted MFS family arabinose efflux permease